MARINPGLFSGGYDTPIMHPTKGKRGGRCNITACQRKGAYWYNQVMKAYYCEDCAVDINDHPIQQNDGPWRICVLDRQVYEHHLAYDIGMDQEDAVRRTGRLLDSLAHRWDTTVEKITHNNESEEEPCPVAVVEPKVSTPAPVPQFRHGRQKRWQNSRPYSSSMKAIRK
jgi:hypothetical protein